MNVIQEIIWKISSAKRQPYQYLFGTAFIHTQLSHVIKEKHPNASK